jgi:hypothetical protein
MVDLVQILLLVLTIALSWSGIGLLNSKLTRRLTELASKQWRVVCSTGAAVFLGGLAVAGILHEPVPQVHDEFSYVLMSNTFASGHVPERNGPGLPPSR